MSEERYTVGLQSKTIFDMKTELYLFDNKIICEVLNAQNSLICEQQATITHLEKVNGKNFAKRRLLEQDNLVLRNENEQLRKEVKNRSAFIIDKGLGDTFVRWKNE